MPTTELWTNNPRSTLAAGINDSALSLTVATGEGARFPNPGANQYFNVTLVDTSGNYEIVKVTARSSDTLTIVRAQQGTSARAFVLGDTVSLRVTKNTLERFVQKDADETITGTLSVPAPTSDNHAARKIDVDAKLSLSGGTMTGALTLNGAPASANHAATKTYVDTGVAAATAAASSKAAADDAFAWETKWTGTTLGPITLLVTYGVGIYRVTNASGVVMIIITNGTGAVADFAGTATQTPGMNIPVCADSVQDTGGESSPLNIVSVQKLKKS